MSDFKLPEKWCVELKNDNWKILFNWAGFTWEWNMCASKYVFSNKTHGVTNFDNYTEITFEQFKKYVLKEEEFKIGDWVTFTSEINNCNYTSKIKNISCGAYCILENNIQPLKKIIRKATQEEIDMVTKKEFTIQDLAEGRCAVINDDSLSNLNLVLKAAFPYDNDVIIGRALYYGIRKYSNGKSWYWYDETELPKQSVKTFLKQLNNNKQMEIIGYKLIKPEYKDAVFTICKLSNTSWLGFEHNNFRKDNVGCTGYEKYVKNLKEAGVLDLWFEPIYKPEVKVFKMQCDGGTFELEVSSKGIYYKLEDSWLYIEDVASLLPSKYIAKMRYINSKSVSSQLYDIKTNTNTKIDVGCKKNTLISEWEQVYNYYKSLV